MTLKIEIKNVTSAEANEICSACSQVVEDINVRYIGDKDRIYDAAMEFSCHSDTPHNIVPRESTPFTRYINNTKKE